MEYDPLKKSGRVVEQEYKAIQVHFPFWIIDDRNGKRVNA